MARQSRRRLLQGSLALAGLGLLSGCSIAPPWQQAKVHRIARLNAGPNRSPGVAALWAAFLMGLRDLGYAEGQNLILDQRDGDGSGDDLRDLSAELVQLQPELIVVSSADDAQRVQAVTSSIPIVSAGAGNLVAQGVAASQAHPGGNVTGLSTPLSVSWRQLQLFRETVPALTHVAVLIDLTTSNILTRETIEAAASSLGLHLTWVGLSSAVDIDPAFATIAREHADGLVVLGGRNIAANQARLAELALAQPLPSLWQQNEVVGLGGLMAYGANRANLYRRAATFADKILRGAKPADLPVEEPTTFDFVINLKTAQRLRLTIPQSVLQQATEVIQ